MTEILRSTSTIIIINSFRTAYPGQPMILMSPRSISISSTSSSLGSNRVSPVLSRPRDPFSVSASSSSEGEVGSEETVVLDVKGMMCDGCASSVKRMLESQPQVSSANVNLSLETATVLPVPEAKVSQNWQQQLGETLAKHLTNCGFESNARV